MRPIALSGHERSITSIKYNREGDLIFSAAKSPAICVWYSDSGERLGTYEGHTGAVWSIDVDNETQHLLSAAADSTVRQWDVETGREINTIRHKVAVRDVGYSYGEKLFFTITDAIIRNKATIQILDTTQKPSKPIVKINVNSESKVYNAIWGPRNQTVYTAGEDGSVRIFDVRTGKELKIITDHTKPVTQIVQSKDGVLFATCSKDGTCRSLQHLKTYTTGRPINSCSISPLKEEVIVGGGQEASNVALMKVDSAQFKVRFFHMIYEDDIGGIPGHFGPVNQVVFQPDGRGFASGGEDGFVRLHHFDSDYFTKFGLDD
ncbi:eukaryotic translation initiation factor 3 subunit I [Planoprotostelium fungivorum]|uniref:Eukaryotic translation initiation factor 3 subunit I n=1 Tax=Planoprotostelium fungivorum TaxID=1890364 RepID=A0A2P6MPF3_9EUKA|nr:eukaryotic translation initiation factor 3 subunit I [Planoprotostelium fungivorum]